MKNDDEKPFALSASPVQPPLFYMPAPVKKPEAKAPTTDDPRQTSMFDVGGNEK